NEPLALGAFLGGELHACTVSSDQVFVTATGRPLTRSTSKTSDRRQVPTSIVISTTPTNMARTLRTNTPYTSMPTRSAGIEAVTAIVHIVSIRMAIEA